MPQLFVARPVSRPPPMSGPAPARLLPGLLLALFLILSAAPFTVHAAGIRYAVPTATGTGSCASWANACTLQTALSGAASGDEIWVKMGLHKPTTTTSRTATFTLKNGVAIYGGFKGTEASRRDRNWPANVTTLSGNIGDTNFSNDNSYHVLAGSRINNTASLDGVVVSGGNADGGAAHSQGGGMTNTGSSSPTLRNITFQGNSAALGGGGMHNGNNSNPVLSNVIFRLNGAALGGGMANNDSSPALSNVTFGDNSATLGGGLHNESASPGLSNVTFSSNSAVYGGGLYNETGSNPTLTVVAFDDNDASADGGGMTNRSSSPALSGVSFSGNSAGGFGGGLHNRDGSSPTLSSVAFDNNSTIAHGGGLFNETGSSPTLSSTTFASNSADRGGGMANSSSSPVLTGVIFSGNSAGDRGGGMDNAGSSSPTLDNVTFSSNAADDGGGMYNEDPSNPTLTNVTFSGNSAWFGGGLYNSSSSPPLTNVTFTSNSAGTSGGGMYNSSSSPTLTNVIFGGNSAFFGGGMYNRDNSSPALTNVTFSGNSAFGNGGGMYNSSSSPTLTNVTFSGNAADGGGGMSNAGSSPAIYNTIFWNNQDASGVGTVAASIANDTATPTIGYSLVQGCKPTGVWQSACGTDGGNNLRDANPLFITTLNPATAPTTAGNFRLQIGSPAVDAGDDAVANAIDLDGTPRIQGVAVDLGPYEQGNATCTTPVSPTVSIALTGASNGEVLLSWVTDPANAGYEIYTSPQPYFNPATTPALVSLPAASNSYTEPAPAAPTFYAIRAAGICGDLSGWQSIMGQFAFTLVPGS